MANGIGTTTSPVATRSEPSICIMFGTMCRKIADSPTSDTDICYGCRYMLSHASGDTLARPLIASQSCSRQEHSTCAETSGCNNPKEDAAASAFPYIATRRHPTMETARIKTLTNENFSCPMPVMNECLIFFGTTYKEVQQECKLRIWLAETPNLRILQE
ncbi:hypothetical protein Pelo_6560 [Pelomyxa schiedti]|nr:hypothetical protein Pelo_6560 [Pelomyxa schiedti]